MVTVKPLCLDCRDEELAAVRVRAGVGHGDVAGTAVLDIEVLVRERSAVDRFAAPSVLVREIAALDHEVGDDAVERCALVAELFARRRADALVAEAEVTEILCRLRDCFAEEADLDAAGGCAANRNVEVDCAGDLRIAETQGKQEKHLVM